MCQQWVLLMAFPHKRAMHHCTSFPARKPVKHCILFGLSRGRDATTQGWDKIRTFSILSQQSFPQLSNHTTLRIRQSCWCNFRELPAKMKLSRIKWQVAGSLGWMFAQHSVQFINERQTLMLLFTWGHRYKSNRNVEVQIEGKSNVEVILLSIVYPIQTSKT